MTSSAPAPNWYDHLPTPISKPASVSVTELKKLLETKEKGKDFVVVDVRRADIEGDAAFLIPGAINLPAHTFHQTLPVLFPLLSQIPLVIFHCGSSSGRGPRVAGWYQDYLSSHSVGAGGSRGLVLAGGIKAWVKEYPEEVVRL